MSTKRQYTVAQLRVLEALSIPESRLVARTRGASKVTYTFTPSSSVPVNSKTITALESGGAITVAFGGTDFGRTYKITDTGHEVLKGWIDEL